MAEQKSAKVLHLEAKMQEMKEKAEKDCAFDRNDLGNQFNNTSAMMWWIAKKLEYSKAFHELELKRKRAAVKVHRSYKTESSLKLTDKEIWMYVEQSNQYVEDDQLCKIVKDIMNFIDGIIDALKSKNFEVNRYMKYLEFINGK